MYILHYRCLLKEAVVKRRVVQLLKMLSVLLVMRSCRGCALRLLGYKVIEPGSGEWASYILPCRYLLKEAVVKIRVVQLLKMFSILVMSSCILVGLARRGFWVTE